MADKDYDSMTDQQLSALAGIPVNSTSRKIVIKRLREKPGTLVEIGKKDAKLPAPRRGAKAEPPVEAEKKRKRGAEPEEEPEEEPEPQPDTRREAQFGKFANSTTSALQSQPLLAPPQMPPASVPQIVYLQAPSAIGECVQCGEPAHPHEHCARKLNVRVGRLEQHLTQLSQRQDQIDRTLLEFKSFFENRISEHAGSLAHLSKSCADIDAAGANLTQIQRQSDASHTARISQLESQIAAAEQSLSYLRSLVVAPQAPPTLSAPIYPALSHLTQSQPQPPPSTHYTTQPPIVPVSSSSVSLSAAAGAGAGASKRQSYILPVTVECVRCHESFLEKNNAQDACKFHPGEQILPVGTVGNTRVSDLKPIYSCCHRAANSAACTHAPHVAKHP